MGLAALGFNKEEETVFKWLNIKHSNSIRSNSSFTYLNIIRKGLSNNSIRSFIEHSNLSKKQVSKIIHVSERTLQRSLPEKELDTNSSERLIELTRLYHKGIEVFNDKDKFNIWLKRPSKSLENRTPLELIETSLGIDLVIDELLKIEYGVFL